MELLTERYTNGIAGELSCFDRLLIVGTLPKACFAGGMTSILYSQKVKIFDYPKWAMEFTQMVRSTAEAISKASKVDFEFVRSHHVRKEDLVQAVLDRRGHHPGLVHILTAMEGCQTFRPWHDKATHKTSLKPETSKCLHYYYYFIDEELGLFHVRVPSYPPFKLQVCLNGHNLLARQMDKAGIGYTMSDNAFIRVDDWAKAQELADTLPVERLHKTIDSYVSVLLPTACMFGQQYHWSIQQAELSHDIVFKRQDTLKPIYEGLVSTAIHVVKPENIATFLGRKLHGNFKGEVGNRYNIRIEGSRISHRMDCNSIKMYDKHGQILRIETTTNDISYFQHYRTVEHKDGTSEVKFANMRKTIYSMGALRECLAASNRTSGHHMLPIRHMLFSQIEDRSHGQKRLEKVTRSVEENGRKYKGFNIFDQDDQRTLMAAIRGEFNIYGFRSRDLAKQIPDKTPSQISRILKCLKLHHLIKRAGKTFKYYLTTLGKAVILNAQKIKEMVLIPQLSY